MTVSTTPHLRALQIGAEWVTESAGGVNRYTEGLSHAFEGLGVEQRWLVMGHANPNSYVRAVAPEHAGLLSRLRAIQAAWPEASNDADVATTHFALYGFPVHGRLRRMPFVAHFHGPWADESAAEGAGRLTVWLKRLIERVVLKQANRFVTLSHAFADVLSSRYGIDPELIHVVPGGVDVDKFATSATRRESRERLGWPIDRPTIICTRRLVKRMGLEQLLDAMQGVVASLPDAFLMIAGKGPLTQTLRERIHSLGLGESIRLLGFVPDDELPLAYRAADVSIVPSQSLEGFGLIIAESLAAGTPPLVTPVGGMPETVGDLSSGLILDDSSPGAIEAGLRAALNGELALPPDEVCRAYARERFAWPVIARQILAVYREAIESHV